MYRALYRKWRPQRFEDVVGQRAIVTALKNQITAGRVGHAYLFTGTRGTGKTTCAKILAKAVNCEHPVDGAPCCQCDSCRGIDAGTLLDVTELDAASNGSVSDARSLREEAIYPPSMLKKRVYIIDEVHMLSKDAFNALLKIMEEPPEHPVCLMESLDLRMDVHMALERLPQELREVTILYFFQEVRQKEIARILGIGLPLVKYRIKRAKELLTIYLGKEDFE